MRIVWDAVPADIGGHESGDVARDVVAALNAAGWLHDPAEVAALRAVAAGLREYYWRLEPGDPPPPVAALVALADLDGGEVRREH